MCSLAPGRYTKIKAKTKPKSDQTKTAVCSLRRNLNPLTPQTL